MIKDTAGNIINEPIQNCSCGLTGRCRSCRPSFIGCISNEEAESFMKKISDWKEKFNADFYKKQDELLKILEDEVPKQ
mgnify:CR=1 FL=1